jgi:hypothetical protein
MLSSDTFFHEAAGVFSWRRTSAPSLSQILVVSVVKNKRDNSIWNDGDKEPHSRPNMLQPASRIGSAAKRKVQ